MMDKRGKQINVCLSDVETKELQQIINESAPEMAAGALIRLGWLYFVMQVKRRGLLAVMADIVGA